MRIPLPAHRVELGVDPASTQDIPGDAQHPQAARISVTGQLLTAVKNVQSHLATHGLQSMCLEVEPDCWMPQGVDVQLRFDQVVMVVNSTSFWFRAESKLLSRPVQTTPADVRFLDAEMARLSLRHRALVAA